MPGRRSAFRDACHAAESSAEVQPGKLRTQLVDERAEARQPFLLLRHDGGRGALDEALVGELGLRLGDLAVDARDFLAQALAFGGDVDLDLQHQAELADDLHRRVAGRQLGAGGRHVRQPGQGGKVGREGGDAFPVAGGEQRHLLRRREVHFPAQAAAGVD
jgi:hypothetical protein